jgi:glyoxylase-like metal-dependent hydrolase (beta-lactamase superfamily II)
MVIERGNTRLRAIATPGHTQGHFVFVDDERSLLYSGDHILPTITPSVGFEAVRNTQALAAFLESLQRVAQLGDLALMPSHGPVGMSSKERTLALLAHHEERLEQILAQVDDGETAYKVASDLQWTRRQLTLDGLEPFSRALAVIETEYHLELLDARGVLTSELVGGVRFYRRA